MRRRNHHPLAKLEKCAMGGRRRMRKGQEKEEKDEDGLWEK